MDPTYTLSPHVRAAADAGGVVFLDIERDRYFSVTHGRDIRIGGRLQVGGALLPLAATTLQSLTRRGLVVPGEKQLPCASVRTADQQIEEGAVIGGQVLSVIAACCRAKSRLKAPFSQLIKKRCASGRAEVRPTHLANLCATFEAWRNYYPRDRVCLFDSVALAEYLAGHGIGVDIVFGVRTRPFEAHCWVQRGSLALNERVARARSFSALMVI